jgi:large repetitive protein
LTLNTGGSFSYTPNLNFNGSDSFTYKANDGTADSNVATVTITVNPVNDAPVADDQAFATDEDVLLQGRLAATDVDGNALTFTRLTNPSHGVVSVQADGLFRYLPTFNFNGTDSFTFRVSDGT